MNSSISSSKRQFNAAISIIWKALLFVLLLYLPSAYILSSNGELDTIDSVVEKYLSGEKEMRYGARYHNHVSRLKHKMTQRLKPDILVLGSSRAMEFRREFFKSEVSFYNAGKATDCLQAMRLFLSELPDDYKPKTLILATDLRWFQEDIYNIDINALFWDKMVPVQPLQLIMRSTPSLYYATIVGDLGRRNIFATRPKEKIGFDAINIGGYRPDGSFDYWRVVSAGGINNPDYFDYGFKKTLRRVYSGQMFDCAASVYEGALNEMTELLKYCKVNQIEIVAFLAPYAPKVWKAIEKRTNAKANFTNEVVAELSSIYTKYGFEFYDFSDSALLGADNNEFIDGWHGSEKTYFRILIKMAEEGKVIKNLIDIEDSKRKLQNSKDSHFEIVHLDK